MVLDKNKKLMRGIPRVDLCFNSEDPRAYAKRRMAAYEARRAAVRRLEYELFLDVMPTDDVPALNAASTARITEL